MSYPLNRYIKGTYKRMCDRCGFDFLRSELKKEYTGLVVCKKCYLEKPDQEKGFKIPVRQQLIRD